MPKQVRNYATDPRRTPALLFFSAIIVVVATYLTVEAIRQFRSDFLAAPARAMIRNLSDKHQSPDEVLWRDAERRLLNNITISPDDSDAHSQLASLYMAFPDFLSLSDQQQAARAAEMHFASAVNLRPSDPRNWANLARARFASTGPGPQYELAWAFAAELGSREQLVEAQLFELSLASYPSGYTPDTAVWLRQVYAGSTDRKRRIMRRTAAAYNINLTDDGNYTPIRLAAPQN